MSLKTRVSRLENSVKLQAQPETLEEMIDAFDRKEYDGWWYHRVAMALMQGDPKDLEQHFPMPLVDFFLDCALEYYENPDVFYEKDPPPEDEMTPKDKLFALFCCMPKGRGSARINS